VQGDHYEVLGVSPSSDDVVIRAAYRALMRRYHPDTDRSAEATERARVINAAYAVLSDPDQRRRYDGSLAARALIKLEPQPMPVGVRVTPGGVAALALVTAAVAAFALSPPMDGLPIVSALFGSAPQTAAVKRATPQQPTPDSAEKGCSTDAAKGLIKAELFDRAARLRGSNPAILTPVADRSLVRIDLAEAKGGAGTAMVSCGGWLALDLPADVAVEGGRRNLNAEIIYAVVPAGSEGLRLTALSGVNGLAQLLATLGRAAEPDAPVELPDEHAAADSSEPAPAPRAVPVPPPVRRIAATVPSRPTAPVRGEVAMSSNLIALDNHLGVFMSQSLAKADATKRTALTASQDRFRKRRNTCRSEACLTAAYVNQMQTVSAIMATRTR